MKSIVIHAPKDLRIEEHAVCEPKAGQVQISVATGGICGSDLHYFNNGGFGSVRLKEPMVLGHEVSGHITKLENDVRDLQVGQLVAISPSRPCNECRYCQKGQQNHCLNMRFYGSAMPYPHIQGAFREVMAVDASQCAVADGLSPGEAAMGEPLAVALHATKQAGEMLGKRVLVTGCGPIGILSILAARRAGASEIVATDLSDFTLSLAKENGADETINMSTNANRFERFIKDKGYFDIQYECSGAGAALSTGIHALQPRGTIVQLGLGGDMSLPMMAITSKELRLIGSFRFHEEFATGISMMQKGLINVKSLITDTFGIDEAVKAFELAGNRTQSMKTQIAFS